MICKGKLRTLTLAGKILLCIYYCVFLRRGVETYVKKYDKCLRFKDILKLPPTEQTHIKVAWLFDMWGIDLIVPFPLSRGNYNYTIVVVGYITKLIESKPLDTIIEKNVINFTDFFIWYQLGVQWAIISDHDTKLSGIFIMASKNMNVKHQ